MATNHIIRSILAIALLYVTIPTVHATGFPPICFTKSQKCCFNFVVCGKVEKKVTETVDCPFEKCSTVCKPVCVINEKKVPFKSCKDVKTKVGETCKKVKMYVNHKWILKNVCKPKFAIKKVCETKIKIVKEKVCKPKCDKVCKTIQATCEKIKILSFPKFCPKLSCDKFVITGSDKTPEDKVGTKSTVVKVIDGKRTMKH